MKARLGPLGAPLAIVIGWVAVRVVVLMPAPEAARPAPAPPRRPATPGIAQVMATDPQLGGISPAALAFAPLPAARRSARAEPLPTVRPPITRHPDLTTQPVAEAPAAAPPFAGQSGIVGEYTPPARPTRPALTGSGWLLINGTGGAIGVPSLGGSQTGFRLFLQGAAAPLALTARVSRALGPARDTEVSAGYALRGRAVGLLVERRERLDAKSGAFVATGYGGIYDVKLPAGLHFDGFAQGGFAGLRQRRWFADGQARLTERAALLPRLTIGAGGGAWASAQQGVRRIEGGPLVEARIAAGAVGLRVAGEYRFRITGDANPRSGPALTIGIDY